jgi:uncharacterized protein (TIGR02246 family)
MTRFHMALASAAILAGLSGAPAAGFGADAGTASETTVRQYLAAWDARDVNEMLRTFTDDAVVILPQQTPIKGKDKIAPLLAAFVKEFSQPGSTFRPGQFTADGSIAYFLWSGDTPSAKYPFGADTFIVHDGKIAYLTLAFIAEPKPAKE